MTTLEKRENLEKRYYKAVRNGNQTQAKKLMNQIINLDVNTLKIKLH